MVSNYYHDSMNKLVEYFLPWEQREHPQFQQLTVFLLLNLLLAMGFISIRLVVDGFSLGSLPSIFGSFIILTLLVGIKQGIQYEAIAWFHGIAIFLIISIASILSGGVEGPLFHLLVLTLFYFPYFIHPKIGMRINFFIIFLCFLYQWLALEVDFEIMTLEDEMVVWISRSFFVFRLFIFIAFAKVLLRKRAQDNQFLLFSLILWVAWGGLIIVFPSQLPWMQSLIYPLMIYTLPRLDWEFQVVFVAANVVFGALMTIHSVSGWLPGVASQPVEIWPNFMGVIVAMVLIFLIQLRDFRSKSISG